MRSIFTFLAVSAACLMTVGAAAAPPETLRINDLTNRAERLPATVTLNKAFNFAGGQSVRAGQEVRVLEFKGREVLVDAGGGLIFTVSPNDCDLLDAANQAWAALTPEQRAVDAQALMSDVSLLPQTTAVSSRLEFNDGTTFQAGQELEVLGVQRDGVQIFARDRNMSFILPYGNTDIIQRARELALLDPDQRPSRIIATLRGSLVDASGQPYPDEEIEDTKVFALLFSASWCGPCRQFSPGFIEYINSVQEENPRLTVVLLSSDQEEDKMYGYMQDEGMPWPAVPRASVHASPVLSGYAGRSIPHLVILDRHGNVLSSSVQGTRYVGVQPPFNTLKQLVSSGATR